jgi:tetratricopeptide (TPR) repeat protein
MRGSFIVAFALCVVVHAEAQFKLYEQGIDAYQQKKYTQTIDLFNEYLDKPTRDKALDVEVHYYLALSYFKTNSHTSAVREFDESLKLGHKNAGNIHWFMAKSYADLKAYPEAIASYEKAAPQIADKPSQAKIFYERALVYDRMGQRPQAIEDINNVLKADATHVEAKKLQREWAGTQVAANTTPSKTPPVDSRPTEKKPDTKKPESSKTEKATVPVAPPLTVSAAAVVPTLAEMYKDEKRYALVIGNGKYKFVSPLKNAENDANDMAAELQRSNFEVIKVINGDYNQMREAFRKFHEKLVAGPKDQTVALFYYAGHGLQNLGENYLVPVEANIQYEDDIPRMCMPVQRTVMANMERSSSRINILVLDACRNNPFPSAYRSAESGLAEVRRARGSFIAYATAPGSVASDGEGRNGLYTQELLNAMRKPGNTIEQVFKEVRKNVLVLSKDRQLTWDSSNIIGDFYFKF